MKERVRSYILIIKTLHQEDGLTRERLKELTGLGYTEFTESVIELIDKKAVKKTRHYKEGKSLTLYYLNQ